MSAISSISIGVQESSPAPAPVHPSVSLRMEVQDDELDRKANARFELDEKPQLCLVAPNGDYVLIEMDDPDYERFTQVCKALNVDPASPKPNCSINFSDAIVERNGKREAYASQEFAEHNKIIADILRKAGCRLPERFYTSSERSPDNAPPSFVRKDSRLSKLYFGYNKIEQSLDIDDEKPTDEMAEKLNMLKRDQLAKRLLKVSQERLEALKKPIPNQPPDLATQSRQQKAAAALESVKGIDKFALFFGAIHSSLSIKDKQQQALELIHSQFPVSKDDIPETDQEYAKELALIGVDSRDAYLRGCHSLGTQQKATQAEHFFVALTERIASGDPVDSLLKGPLFEKTFGKLDEGDQVGIRDMLLEECRNLREVYLAKTLNVADGEKAPVDLPDGRKWEDLFKPPVKPQTDSRGKILHDAVQSEMRRLLNDLERAKAAAAP